MAVSISRELIESILDAAQASPAREICGLLLGQGETVTAIVPAANVAAEPERRFEIDPAVLIGAHRHARSGGPAVLGHYHSHPSGDVAPSHRDAEMAHADGALWLICDAARRYRLWQSAAGGLHDRFRSVLLRIIPETGGGGQSSLASPAS